MKIARKKRLTLVIVLMLGISSAAALVLYALKNNINLYYTPQQVYSHHPASNQLFRMGGVVVRGSVQRVPNSLNVSFILTDFHKQIRVQYDGLLPSLFREGQGIVAEGKLNGKGVFVADQVLAKHDANYHPPNIPNHPSRQNG